MATCFLFTSNLSDDKCLSIKVGPEGQILEPLAIRSFDEFIILQNDSRTIVVMPAHQCSLHEVELPWLAERKARAAIPYALEDQLAQPVTELHFIFDRQHYQQQKYLVAVVDRDLIEQLQQKISELSISFDVLTLDWFALNENEACFTTDSFLVNVKTFKGALSLDLAPVFLNKATEDVEVLAFSDSRPIQQDTCLHVDSPSNQWIAQRLLHAKLMNICQGEFQQRSGKNGIEKWYKTSAIFFGIWLMSIFFLNLINSSVLSNKISKVDNEIAIVYRQFFPEAQRIISPRFRVEQLIKSSAPDSELLWNLLGKVAKSFDYKEYKLEQLRFQNQVLSISLQSSDFASLEKLVKKLKKNGAKVTQTQASTQDEKVLASLELRL